MKNPTEYEKAKEIIEKSNDLQFLKNVLIEIIDNSKYLDLSEIPTLEEKVNSIS